MCLIVILPSTNRARTHATFRPKQDNPVSSSSSSGTKKNPLRCNGHNCLIKKEPRHESAVDVGPIHSLARQHRLCVVETWVADRHRAVVGGEEKGCPSSFLLFSSPFVWPATARQPNAQQQQLSAEFLCWFCVILK